MGQHPCFADVAHEIGSGGLNHAGKRLLRIGAARLPESSLPNTCWFHIVRMPPLIEVQTARTESTNDRLMKDGTRLEIEFPLCRRFTSLRAPDWQYLDSLAEAGADVAYILTGKRSSSPAPLPSAEDLPAKLKSRLAAAIEATEADLQATGREVTPAAKAD